MAIFVCHKVTGGSAYRRSLASMKILTTLTEATEPSEPMEADVLQQSSLLGNNPFAVLTAIVAPALLTTLPRSWLWVLATALLASWTAPGWFTPVRGVGVGGSILIYYGVKTMFEVAAGLAVLTAASAVIGLATGCTPMVHEARLAEKSLAQEGEIWKRQRSAATLLPK